MKFKLFLFSIIVCFFIGCDDEAPMSRDFPIIRTLAPTQVNESGATFHCELVKKGKSPTTSYGFIWGLVEPDLNISTIIVLGTNINSSTFSIRMDSTLFNGAEYKIKAFATYGNDTVYGNTISFRSEGCAHNPWSLLMVGTNLAGSSLNVSSDGDLGYITSAGGYAFIFDPIGKTVKKSLTIPVSAGLRQFNSASIDNKQYLFNSKLILKKEGGIVSEIAKFPFVDEGYSKPKYFGFAVPESLYLFNGSSLCYLYQIKTNTWQQKTIPIVQNEKLIDVIYAKDKAYFISTFNNIWEYDPKTDQWLLNTSIPDNMYTSGFLCAYNDQLYFRLKENEMNQTRSFCRYDLKAKRWDKMDAFPIYVTSGDLFYFNIHGQVYVCNLILNGHYNFWKFDPSKV